MLRPILLSITVAAFGATVVQGQGHQHHPQQQSMGFMQRVQSFFSGGGNSQHSAQPQHVYTQSQGHRKPGGFTGPRTSHAPQQHQQPQQMGPTSPPQPPQLDYNDAPRSPAQHRSPHAQHRATPRHSSPQHYTQQPPIPTREYDYGASSARSAMRTPQPGSTSRSSSAASPSRAPSSRASSGYASDSTGSAQRPSSTTYEKSPSSPRSTSRGYSSRRPTSSAETARRSADASSEQEATSSPSVESSARRGSALSRSARGWAAATPNPPDPVADDPSADEPSNFPTPADTAQSPKPMARDNAPEPSSRASQAERAPHVASRSSRVPATSSRAVAAAAEPTPVEPEAASQQADAEQAQPAQAPPVQAEPEAAVAGKPQPAPATSNTAAALPTARDVANRDEAAPRATSNRGLGAQGVLFRRSGPQLSVETIGPKQIVLNRDASYQLVLRNSGDTPAREVTVTVDVPAWADVVELSPSTGSAPHPKASGGGTVRWSVAELAAQGEETLMVKLLPRESKPLQLAVQWDSAPVSSQVNVEVKEPKLLLTIKGPDEVEFGDRAVYELTFDNPGTADAERVMVKLMPIDPGDSTDAHEIGTITAGTRKVVEIELIARQQGKLLIQAEASAEGGLRSNVNYDVLVRRPALKIEIQGPEFRYARTEGSYRILVHNPGTSPARNVKVGLNVPANTTVQDISHGGKLANEDSQEQIRWSLESLPAGETQTLEVRCALEQPGTCRLQAVAVADGNLRDTNFISTEVEAVAELALDVRDPRGPLPVNEEVTYEIILRNRGTKAAESVHLVASFSPGMEPLAASGTTFEIRGGQVSLGPVRLLNAGEELKVQLKARAVTAGNHEFRVEANCQALDVRLAQQGTTRYYGDGGRMAPQTAPRTATAPSRPSSSRRFEALPPVDDEPLRPTPDPTSDHSMEPTPAGEPTPAAESTPAGEPTPAEPTPAEPTSAEQTPDV